MNQYEDKYHEEYQGLLSRHNNLDTENPVELQSFIDDLKEFIKGKTQQTRSIYYANKNFEKHKKYLQLSIGDKMKNTEIVRTEKEPIPYQEAVEAMGFVKGYLDGNDHDFSGNFIDAINVISQFVEENHPQNTMFINTAVNIEGMPDAINNTSKTIYEYLWLDLRTPNTYGLPTNNYMTNDEADKYFGCRVTNIIRVNETKRERK